MKIEKISYNQNVINLSKNSLNQSGIHYKRTLLCDSFEKLQTNKTNSAANITFGSINFEQVKLLTNAISRNTNSKKRVIQKYADYPEAEGLTLGGGLPEAWMKRIKDVSKFDKEVFFEKLGEIFTIDRHYADVDVLSKNIEKLFKEQGIAQETDKVTTKYVGMGFFGRTFKIDINGEDSKVIKEFKRTYRYHNNHGNYSEQNLAEYINEYAGKNTDMVRYYFGDTKNGILAVDYISSSTPVPQKRIHLDELGLAYDDPKPANYVGDYIIDFGGLITVSNLVGNKQAQAVYRKFKNIKDADEKIKLFNEIFSNNKDLEYQNNLIGLTHSIKFLPEEIRGDLFTKMASLNNSRVDVAIVENIKNFGFMFNGKDILERIAASPEKKVQEVVAREIKHFPDSLRHKIFEDYSTIDNPKLKKYLARNINYYYKNIGNRVNIFDNLSQNTDLYADIALANSLKWLGSRDIAVRYENFFNKNDVILSSVLIRNIDLFKENYKMIEKWINKFMEIDDPRIKRSLCEIVGELPEDIQIPTFEKLLTVDDMNAKEFLAQSFFSIQYFENHTNWLIKLLENSDNSVKRVLASNINRVKSPKKRQEWANLILNNADSSVKEIIESNKS